jgi:hypothetical protein
MTASDLHTLIADVPEVVPECLHYRSSDMPAGPYWVIKNDGGLVIETCVAADLICGQVKRMPSMKKLVIGQDENGHCCWHDGNLAGEAPTELEAVLAAYRASRK